MNQFICIIQRQKPQTPCGIQGFEFGERLGGCTDKEILTFPSQTSSLPRRPTRAVGGSDRPERQEIVTDLNYGIAVSLVFRWRDHADYSPSGYDFGSNPDDPTIQSQNLQVVLSGARHKKALVLTQERDAPCPVSIDGAGTGKRAPSIPTWVVPVGRKGVGMAEGK